MGKSENAIQVTNCSQWSIHTSLLFSFRLHCTDIGSAAMMVGSVSVTIATSAQGVQRKLSSPLIALCSNFKSSRST